MTAGIKPLDYVRAILGAGSLSASEKIVAVAVMSHAGPDGRDAHPGVKLLAQETQLSERTVIRSLRSLREKGWLLQVFSGRGGAHDKASVLRLAVPKCHGGTLAGQPQSDMVSVQSDTDDIPKCHHVTSNALINAPINAPIARACARAADQPRSRKVQRARQDQPRFTMRHISVPEPEYYPEPDISPGLQPPALVSGNEPDWA